MEELKMLASDIDYACTKNDITLDDKIEIAKALTILGYHKTIWHKVADGDLPKENDNVWCYLRYDDVSYHFYAAYTSNKFYARSSYDGIWEDITNNVIAWTELPRYEEN